ncbi:hypothetical protein OnM2_021100 [Erysiphe neolycopersici]|uniref:Methyltransferase domain-containing protein n=1 Tax=Erysiphe neolycopersici TaxID=212602 RepID=A0A420I2X9_9PEZI|nr:hypothetical protein OnM2_021100 [Erysiphe neolycopersici]
MAPSTPLPYSLNDFQNTNEYVESLLNFCTTSTLFQTLCGGVHILDFYTQDQSAFRSVIPLEWQDWLLSRDTTTELLDFLMRRNLDTSVAKEEEGAGEKRGLKNDEVDAAATAPPPDTLVDYIRQIRRLSLNRHVSKGRQQQQQKQLQLPKKTPDVTKPIGSLPRHITVGMVPKKIHEVENFSRYVVRLADDIVMHSGKEITHFVDIGSGQNYLGRALASPLYNKQIIAIENKEININSAKNMDIFANAAKRETVMRNKKLYRLQRRLIASKSMEFLSQAEKRKRIEELENRNSLQTPVDLRPSRELDTIYVKQVGKGYIHYVHHKIIDGDLTDIIDQIERIRVKLPPTPIVDLNLENQEKQLPVEDNLIAKVEDNVKLMVVSIHSCGNLSHHGIKSLLQNDKVYVVAIIGCCYNLLSERFSYSSLKHPLLRPNKCAINAPPQFVNADGEAYNDDSHGFPMSNRVATYNEKGLRLNITARMMAVQAPNNWTEKESETFFTRHFYRALFQRVLLDRGIVQLSNQQIVGGALESTDSIIIGTLRKKCHESFRAYVRGAIEKLLSQDSGRGGIQISEKLNGITDEEIDGYVIKYEPFKKELSVTWSLMAFSAILVESLIIVDRWLYLKEHSDIVEKCWVEPVFDYQISPRNMVVVGIKR